MVILRDHVPHRVGGLFGIHGTIHDLGKIRGTVDSKSGCWVLWIQRAPLRGDARTPVYVRACRVREWKDNEEEIERNNS